MAENVSNQLKYTQSISLSLEISQSQSKSGEVEAEVWQKFGSVSVVLKLKNQTSKFLNIKLEKLTRNQQVFRAKLEKDEWVCVYVRVSIGS